MAGTVNLKSERLILRKHVLEDAVILHEVFGLNSNMYEYSGWNPYETPQIAKSTVEEFIGDYSNEHFYAWAIEKDSELVGTVGAYDYDIDDNSIEVGFSIAEKHWGKGFASEALKCVLDYLTDDEGISTVKAWCAADNIGSLKVLEKSGMKQIDINPDAIHVGENSFDKINFEKIKK